MNKEQEKERIIMALKEDDLWLSLTDAQRKAIAESITDRFRLSFDH